MQNRLTNLTIRELTRTEATFDNALAMFKVSDTGFPNGSPWSVEQFFTTLKSVNAIISVALLPESEPTLDEQSPDGKIIGFIISTKTTDEAEIYLIVVDEQYKKRGVAKEMFTHFIEQCKQAGLEQVYLEVRESNTPAIRLYETLKFEKVGLRKAYYSSPIEDAIVMKLDLTREEA